MNGVWGCLACREHPGASKKKGADGGVDGEIFFRDHPDPKEKPQAKPMRQWAANTGSYVSAFNGQ